MRASRLAFDPERGEGVVGYADAVIARRAGRLLREAAVGNIAQWAKA
ncbi:hypothetical protein AB0428_33225, partial [Streptomyces virginiae]